MYFIGERKQQVDTYSTRHSIQLRRLTLGGRCGQLFPVTSTDPFDLDACSRLIALVASETYSKSPLYQPLEGLLAVPAGDGSAVDIYLQVIHSHALSPSTRAVKMGFKKLGFLVVLNKNLNQKSKF